MKQALVWHRIAARHDADGGGATARCREVGCGACRGEGRDRLFQRLGRRREHQRLSRMGRRRDAEALRREAGACEARRHRQRGRQGGRRKGRAARNEGGTRRSDLDQRRELRLHEAAGPAVSAGWAEKLPNWRYVDVDEQADHPHRFHRSGRGPGKPLGHGASWCSSTTRRAPMPASMPKSAERLLAWAKENPGRFTYPQPPDFIGSSFLKQVLIELVADRVRAAEAGGRGDVRRR